MRWIFYNFPCDFLGKSCCVRATAYVFDIRASCDFFYGASGATRGKSVQSLCLTCTERPMSVQLPCSLRSLRTEIVRSPCGYRPSDGARAGIVRMPPNDMFQNGLTIFSNLYNFSLNQIVEFTEPVNPYEQISQPPDCLRREACTERGIRAG